MMTGRNIKTRKYFGLWPAVNATSILTTKTSYFLHPFISRRETFIKKTLLLFLADDSYHVVLYWQCNASKAGASFRAERPYHDLHTRKHCIILPVMTEQLKIRQCLALVQKLSHVAKDTLYEISDWENRGKGQRHYM